MPTPTRIETDMLGEGKVPAQAYYGVNTVRAVENFSISGIPISSSPDLINALACVKQAAALANHELGLLDAEHTRAIVAACEEIRAGKLHDQFVVDVIQGGAGTSTNMNANEVIANRALELMGRARGDYAVLHPNEHLNLSQSTNDAVPTALKIASWVAIHRLIDAMDMLRVAFAAKATRVQRHPENGAHPAAGRGADDARPGVLDLRCDALRGHAAPARSGEPDLRDQYGRDCRWHGNHRTSGVRRNGTQTPGTDHGHSVRYGIEPGGGNSGCGSIRASVGSAQAGRDQAVQGVQRPAPSLFRATRRVWRNQPAPVQAGSSIMPGKVNPVIPEVVNQIAFEVIGNDVTVSFAAEAGQLQLNAFLPIIAHSIFKSLLHLRNGCLTLAERCVRGITANRERLEEDMNARSASSPRSIHTSATRMQLRLRRKPCAPDAAWPILFWRRSC